MTDPKPLKAEAFVCPRCGAQYEESGHARLCIKNHIPPRDLRVRGAIGREGSERVYAEGDRWPSVIEVWCSQSQTVVLYKRLPTHKKPDFGDGSGGKRSPVIV
jgi:hypothetical protein